MNLIYGIGIFMLSSSAVMVGYVWVRDIKNTRAQAANAHLQQDESFEATKASEEILSDYPNLIKKSA